MTHATMLSFSRVFPGKTCLSGAWLDDTPETDFPMKQGEEKETVKSVKC